MSQPTPIVNESTSVVQIDGSALQNGTPYIVYISSSAIPGHLVTVKDATGFISTPQSIFLSTVGGVSLLGTGGFPPVSSIQQKFGYLTLHAENSSNWTVINENPFSDPLANYALKSVDALQTFASTVQVRDTFSTMHTQSRVITDLRDLYASTVLYASTAYIQSLPRYFSSAPGDLRFNVNGRLKVYGSTATVGSLVVGGSVLGLGDYLAGGRFLSTRQGVLDVRGDLRTMSSVRAQREPSTGILYTRFINAGSGPSQFGGILQTSREVTATSSFFTQQMSTSYVALSSAQITSSLQFGPTAGMRIHTAPTSFEFFSTVLVSRSVSTNTLQNLSQLRTSSFFTQNLADTPSLSSMTFRGATIFNPKGSLAVSSFIGQTIQLTAPLYVPKATVTGVAQVSGLLALNDDSGSAVPITLQYPRYRIAAGGTPTGSISFDRTWLISSPTETAGILQTSAIAYDTLLTDTYSAFGRRVTALEDTSLTRSTFASTFSIAAGGSFQIRDTTPFLQLSNANLNITGGSIFTNELRASTATVSSIRADFLSSTGGTITFDGAGGSTFASTATISTLTARSILTSSLVTLAASFGSPATYSTLNPSTPWVLTSTYLMNAPPFTKTTGLGTAFNPITYTSIQSGAAFYSVIDPLAQIPVTLSSVYVNTFAGNGARGFTGDGGQATQAKIGLVLGQPAVDSANNVYFGGQFEGWRVRRVGAGGAGTIQTIAGRYQFLYGDGGAATAAAMSAKLFVSVYGSNTALVTDASNNRVRYVDASGVITTVAGSQTEGYSGDGGPATQATFIAPSATLSVADDSYYVVDTGANVIRKVTAGIIQTVVGTGTAGYSGDGGPATAARLSSPVGIVTSSEGDLLIADTSNNVIRRVSAATSTIATVAGTGAAGYSGDGGAATAALLKWPTGIAMDSNDDYYIADSSNNVIRKVSEGVITTVAGTGTAGYGGDGGPATAALLNCPLSVTIDRDTYDIYIADTFNQCVRKVTVSTGDISTVAGSPGFAGYGGDGGPAAAALLSNPSTVFFDTANQRLYIADEGNCRIRCIDIATGIISTFAGNGSPLVEGDGGPALNAMFGSITSVAADPQSNLYIVDSARHKIRKIDAVTSTITTYAGTGTAGYSGDGGPATAAQLFFPFTATLGASNALFFTDEYNSRVRRVDPTTGIITTVAGNGAAGYDGDGGPATAAALNYPRALATDSAKNLYIGDTSNYRVRRVDRTTGLITTYLGAGYQDPVIGGASTLDTPLQTTTALGFDTLNQLYFTEYETNRLWQLNSNLTVQPFSGFGTSNYYGDGGSISSALFYQPTGLTFDLSDSALICDSGNNRIRRTYTFGNPRYARYLNMRFTYSNYSTLTGEATINVNGNVVKTFSAATGLPDSFTMSDVDIYSYNILSNNPVLSNQVPYVTVTQTDTAGYTQLKGTFWVNQVPGQQTLATPLNSNAGIVMNYGSLRFPNSLRTVTIDNPYNDASMRSLFYTGSLVNASDPALKECVEAADLGRCRAAVEAIPLRRFSYITAYEEAFQVRDRMRLGLLTTEVTSQFPKSVGLGVGVGAPGAPGGLKTLPSPPLPPPLPPHQTLDLTQIRFAHLGLTQLLLKEVKALEQLLAAAALPTQRKSIH